MNTAEMPTPSNPSGETAAKNLYHTPTLHCYGTLEKLTETSNTIAGNDNAIQASRS